MTTDPSQKEFLPSLNRITKELKREENSLYNCINSILIDTSFVQQIAALHPELPLYANLRCGRWYTPDPDGTCYFKSTDGHFGEWSFSITRLNWHVALAAAEKGGCIIVDATRRGKTFPDALTKTIPIWAAVINKAVRVYRQKARQQLITANEAAPSIAHPARRGANALGCSAEDAELSSSAGTTASSSEGANKLHWDEEIHLPIWISSTEKAQIDQHLQEWAEKLTEAGIAVDKLAEATKKPFRPLWISQSSRIWLNEVPCLEELDFTPLILISASVPDSRQRLSHRIAATADGQAQEVAFDYVSGAGDDEESWAKGLTPEMFWQNKELLLCAGPRGVEDVMQALLRPSDESVSKRLSCPTAPPEGASQTPSKRGTSQSALHCLPPIGCRNQHAASSPTTSDKPCFVGETGLALGSRQAASAPELWTHVEAVLNVGSQEDLQLAGFKDKYLHLYMKSSKQSRHDLQNSLAEALHFIHRHLLAQNQVLVHCDTGTDQSICVVLAALLCLFTEPDSKGKPQLRQTFPEVLSPKAAAYSLATFSKSTSFQGQESLNTEESALPSQSVQRSVRCDKDKHQTPQSDNLLVVTDPKRLHPSLDDNSEVGISKGLMRQRLAYISSYYPAARPSRGNLKEVYKFARTQSDIVTE